LTTSASPSTQHSEIAKAIAKTLVIVTRGIVFAPTIND
jgi:hypothetical protein